MADLQYAQLSFTAQEIDKRLNTKSNYGENDATKAGYLQNRPFWHVARKLEWDGASYDRVAEGPNQLGQLYQLDEWIELIPEGSELVGAQCKCIIEGSETTLSILAYCQTYAEYESYLNLEEPGLIAIEASAVGFYLPAIIITLLGVGEGGGTLCCCLREEIMEGMPRGIYTTLISETTYLAQLDYSAIEIKEEYKSFFKGLSLPIHVLQIVNIDNAPDFSMYQPGDIILAVLPAEAVQGASNGL